MACLEPSRFPQCGQQHSAQIASCGWCPCGGQSFADLSWWEKKGSSPSLTSDETSDRHAVHVLLPVLQYAPFLHQVVVRPKIEYLVPKNICSEAVYLCIIELPGGSGVVHYLGCRDAKLYSLIIKGLR